MAAKKEKPAPLKTAAANRRAAAIPAAPAPTMIVSVSPEAAGAPSAGAARTAPVPARNDRRLNDVMVCDWLPSFTSCSDFARMHRKPQTLWVTNRCRGPDEPICKKSRLNMAA